MVLRVSEADPAGAGRPPSVIDLWAPPGPRFIRSPGFEILRRELKRYTAREVLGASFLIAGHRGAGKTTLVLRAVQDVGREALEAASDVRARSPVPQRPLLVKLHGPSLLTPELPSPGADTGKKGGTAETAGGRPVDEAHAALVQITISLYRALAAEIARTFTLHARDEAAARPRDDVLELAGQLRLELDRAPGPALLHSFWRRLGRLGAGVLWPGHVGTGPADQGVREVVAVATAAQAYQVCSGAVSYQQVEKDTTSREASAEAKAQGSPREVLNAVVGLAAGGLVGLGVLAQSGQAGGAAAAGVGVALLANLTLGVSGKRALKREQSLDYSFILDRTVQTLDRDLPLVIERVRDAGLAPVFLVDELDKLEVPDQAIERLINRLKHLMADYGLFCFLTDRSYFEAVEKKLQTTPYGKEHTFFTYRLFVHYRPHELASYLQQILVSDAGADSSEAARDEPLRRVLVRHLMHRARLNTTNVFRELARLTDDQGRLRPESVGFLSSPRCQLGVTIQLAIEDLLARELREVVEREPRLAQVAADALYLVSDDWEAGEDQLDASRQRIGRRLLKAFVRTVPDEDSAVLVALRPHVGRDGLDPFVGAMAELAGRLCDLGRLLARLADTPALDEQERSPLLGIVPHTSLPSLLEPVTREPPTYRFLADRYGVERAFEQQMAGNPDLFWGAVDQRDRDLEAVASGLGQLELPPEALAARGILPQAPTYAAVLNARERLRRARPPQPVRPSPEQVQDLQTLRTFLNAVAARQTYLGNLMVVAVHVAHDASVPLVAALDALGRYVDLPAAAEGRIQDPLLLDAPATGAIVDRSRPASWLQAARSERDGLATKPPALEQLSEQVWDRWSARLAVATSVGPFAGAFAYDEVVLAAADVWPGSLFRRPLSAVDVEAWSELYLRAFPTTGSPPPPPADPQRTAPPWAAVAALWALRFPRDLLQRLTELVASALPASTEQDRLVATCRQLAAGAPDGSPGLLVRLADRGPPTETLPGQLPQPTLMVRAKALSAYSEAIRWLADQGGLAGVGVQHGSESDQGLDRP